MQKAATQLVENAQYRQMRAASTPFRLALITALSAPHAASFLTVLPTQPCYQLDDASLRLAVRHRLGLLPFNLLHRQRCVCRSNNGPKFVDDPDHFMACERHRRTFLTQRHNNIVQVLEDLARSVGFYATREPNWHVRPDDVKNLPAASEKYNQHADLLLLKHNLKLYIDVALTRPTTPSNLASSLRMQDTVLYSTRSVVQVKHRKYDEIARVNNYHLFAFAMESYGGLCPEAESLLGILARHSKEYTAAVPPPRAPPNLRRAQASNANIALLGIQRLHLQQHHNNSNSYAAYERQRSIPQARPVNSSALEFRLKPILLGAEHDLQLPSDGDAFVHQRRVAFADVRPTSEVCAA